MDAMAGAFFPKVDKVDKQTQTDDGPPSEDRRELQLQLRRVASGPEDGFHYVQGHDGTRLRFRLLLGGPGGDHRVDREKRTVICLHGLGERLESWEEMTFRQQELPASYTERSPSIADRAAGMRLEALLDSQPEDGRRPAPKPKRRDCKRRAKLVQGLAKRLNVALVDLRGFGGSGRPASVGPIEDTSLVAVYSFRLMGDMRAFTEAARADIQASRRAGTESHTISVSGSTAMVRVVHRDAARFVASQRWLRLEESTKAPVRLFRLDLCGRSEALDAADPDGRREARRLVTVPHSYKVDKIDRLSEDILVIHELELSEEEDPDTTEAAFQRCIEEMRRESSCLSFSISRSRTAAALQATLADSEAAVQHLRRVTAWFAPGEDGEAAIGSQARLYWTQVHARGSAVQELKAKDEVQDLDVQFFQIFPLSFQSALATEAPASMSDFVQDVESVREYLNAPRVSILGHSFGAAVALHYAVDRTTSVERLASLGGWSRMEAGTREMWSEIAGDTAGWTESVIRGAILDEDIEAEHDSALDSEGELHKTDVPMLLVNAQDDFLVPADVAKELRAALPNARLETPAWGGHDAAAVNDEVLERTVQFLLADEAMVFADDPLCAEIIASPWNIGSDKAFARYYDLGRALAEVERAHRRLRLISNWARDCEFQDERSLRDPSIRTQEQMAEMREQLKARKSFRSDKIQEEQAAKFAALDQVGLADAWQKGVKPQDILIHAMSESLEQMCAPARTAVEQAGVWWRDSGKAVEGYTDGKYTVDAWGRRRGGSKKHNCAWFRWDLSCVPPRLRDGYAMEAPDAEIFSCWWCGGLPTDHKNLGRMGEDEEPGYFPGIAAGRHEWKPPLTYGLPTGPAPVLDEEGEAAIVPLEPWADEWGPPFRRIRVT